MDNAQAHPSVLLAVVTAAVTVQCLVVISLPWVPSERITIKNGGENKTSYVYVFGQQGKQTMILKRTAVTGVSEDDHGDRSICNESSPFTDWYWKPYTMAFSDFKDLAEQARQDCKDGSHQPSEDPLQKAAHTCK